MADVFPKKLLIKLQYSSSPFSITSRFQKNHFTALFVGSVRSRLLFLWTRDRKRDCWAWAPGFIIMFSLSWEWALSGRVRSLFHQTLTVSEEQLRQNKIQLPFHSTLTRFDSKTIDLQGEFWSLTAFYKRYFLSRNKIIYWTFLDSFFFRLSYLHRGSVILMCPGPPVGWRWPCQFRLGNNKLQSLTRVDFFLCTTTYYELQFIQR